MKHQVNALSSHCKHDFLIHRILGFDLFSYCNCNQLYFIFFILIHFYYVVTLSLFSIFNHLNLMYGASPFSSLIFFLLFFFIFVSCFFFVFLINIITLSSFSYLFLFLHFSLVSYVISSLSSSLFLRFPKW